MTTDAVNVAFQALLFLSPLLFNSAEWQLFAVAASLADIDNNTFVSLEGSQDLSSRHRMKEKPAFLIDRFPPGDPMLPSPDGKGPYCRKEAKCERLNNTFCLGAKLPYSSTTLELVGMTQEQVQEKLQFWMALKHVPRCWAVIQPFLCALYMPRCDNGLVDLPSQEMCIMALNPCRILDLERGWTSPLRCNDSVRFPPTCKNDVREVRFNTTAQCLSPLVSTDNPSSFYENVEGCGMQCANPMFTPDEHRQIHELIAWAGGICFAMNLFTVISFLIDWRSANKYPALIIFYINFCFMVACVGFLAQFLPGAREGIVCRKDGTLRMSEPSAGENLSCVIVFVLIYYSLMAACVWFVILTYAWHLSFRALGKIQERIDKKAAYFHLVAWSLPLVLTITTMAIGEVDANSEMGVCFVGYINPAARGGLLLGPIAVFFATGGYFLMRGLITLIKVKINSQEIISERASAKIHETIVRMGLFTLFMFVFVVVTFVVHFYEFNHRRAWRESFRTFMTCKIMRSGGVLTDGVGLTGHGDCRMEVRPSLAMVQLHLLALFTAGVVMSSWVWTSSTAHTWARFFKRKFNQEDDEPVQMKKHKVIAQVFAKRQAFNRAGRISISIHSTHDDPVGLNFELNSAASRDMSSTWAAALPKFVTRRGALIDPATGSVSSQYRHSLDSDFSYCNRRVSLDSRRQSLDSQYSIALGEYSARKAASTPVPPPTSTLGGVSSGRVKPRHKRRRREFGRSRVGPLFNRRGSTTSQESQLGAQILSSLAIGNPTIPSLVPNLKRRTGNAGLLDDQTAAHEIQALFRHQLPSDFTDDNTSLAPSDLIPISVLPRETLNDKNDVKENDKLTGESQKETTEEHKAGKRKGSLKIEGGIINVENNDGNGRRGSKTSGKRRSSNSGKAGEVGLKQRSKDFDFKVNSQVADLVDGKKTVCGQVDSDVDSSNEDFPHDKKQREKNTPRKTKVDTITNQGKKYESIKPGQELNESHSGDESQSDSDAESVPINGDNLDRSNKKSIRNSRESRRQSDTCKVQNDSLKYQDLSDSSITSHEPELSLLARRSSLSGVSCGPSKPITVSSLKKARDMGTQTSNPNISDINSSINMERERPNSGTESQVRHHTTGGGQRLTPEKLLNSIKHSFDSIVQRDKRIKNKHKRVIRSSDLEMQAAPATEYART